MSTTAYAWAPITKVEDQPDGTVIVYGPVADSGPDRDKQRLNQAWLDREMPAWMAEGANVREQHDSLRAVGVGVGLTRQDDGTHLLAAAVVDPVAVTKVKPGPGGRPPVLKGFSIGIKGPELSFGKADAPNGEIVGGKIIEVSLVDRPANPRTLFTMVKADAAGELADVPEPELVEEPVDEPDPVDPEVTGKAEAVLAEVRQLVPDLTKADTAGDIADAQAAIAAIAKIIQSEAASLAAGQLSDECDIACLLDAVRALKYFISCEQAEVPVPAPAASEVADSTSVSGGTYTMAETKTDTTTTAPAAGETPDVTKVDGQTDVAAIVKAAVAEATAATEERFKALEADLAKALAMPAAGGPAATRTASQTAAARDKDRDQLRAEARDLLAKADAIQRDDSTAAMGYRERARAALAKADL